MEEPMDGTLQDRIRLIEAMMLEGRRSTEYWGWTFLLWGVAYLVALAWQSFGPYAAWSWPVTMTLAAVVMALVIRARRRRNPQPRTVRGRALMAIWGTVGTALFLFTMTAAVSGHGDAHVLLGGVEILLAVANGASAVTLGWRAQMGIALVWAACGVASEFVPEAALLPILLAGTLVGNLGWGLYLMYRESADRRRQVRYA